MNPEVGHVPADFDLTTPNVARVYNALLGGKDNYAVDREVAAELVKVMPEAETIARENRHFLARAVHYLASEVGIDQFIDVGAGLPTLDNTHEVAHWVNPSARVVYVDNDPVVLAHARALLDSHGLTAVITGDLRDPAAIIVHPDTRALIDFTEPVAVIFASVLHFVPGSEAGQVVGAWRQAMAPGSCLAVSHAEARPELEAAADLYQQRMSTGHPRSRDQIEALFAGFDMVDPGLVALPLWRPDFSVLPEGAETMPVLAGVGQRGPDGAR